jgi:hypothetical protein
MKTLKAHYGQHFQEGALPNLHQVENRMRVRDNLELATRNCNNKYLKGNRTFKILAKLTPEILRQHLPSFVRVSKILRDKSY